MFRYFRDGAVVIEIEQNEIAYFVYLFTAASFEYAGMEVFLGIGGNLINKHA